MERVRMRLQRPRWWVLLGGILLISPIVAVAALNLFVAVALPAILNGEPERTRIDYGLAFMIRPGVIEVRNLRIRSQSRTDQWVLEADRARATVDLRALRERRFVAEDLVGDGVSFRYRLRTDEPDPDVPPIPGLDTSLPDPASIGPPGNPWGIELDRVALSGVRELWIEDYRYLGGGTVTGRFSLSGPGRFELDDVVLALEGGDVTLGEDPVASAVDGVVQASIVADGDAPLLDVLEAQAAVVARIEDLRFLDEYLGATGWLSLRGGKGAFVADATVSGGELRPGSRMSIAADGLQARFFSYQARGDGEVTAEVVEEEGAPESRIRVAFRDFTLVRGEDPRPLVEGEGLVVHATSPDVALDRPFARVDFALDLPTSTVPDLTVYNTFLPSKLDLAIRGGRGQIRGKLRGTTDGQRGSGEIVLTGAEVHGAYADLDVVGDFEVVGRVPAARLDAWRFDLSGSTVQLRNVTIDGKRKDRDDSHAWWAAFAFPTGFVAMEDATFFDATMDVRFRDSVPFVTMFTERKPLPGWIRGLLAIEDVSGRTRIRVGDDALDVDRLELSGEKFEVRMKMRRQKALSRGILYARLGALSVGVRLHGNESDLHLVNAKRWYEAQPAL